MLQNKSLSDPQLKGKKNEPFHTLRHTSENQKPIYKLPVSCDTIGAFPSMPFDLLLSNKRKILLPSQYNSGHNFASVQKF